LSEGIALETKKLMIPFCVLSESRKDPFTKDLEMATIFSLAELDRGKGGGLIIKQPEERIEFIAPIGYPLWLYTGSEKVLIFDGLNMANYTFPYVSVPNVKDFMENLKRASKTRETHREFVRDHINYFQASPSEKGLLVKGLIVNPSFLNEFESCRREATETNERSSNAALLVPTIDESAISSGVHELEKLHFILKEEMEELYKCMKLLNRATNNFVKELHGEIRLVAAEFAAKINAEEAFVTPKIEQIKDDYDAQTKEVGRNSEKQRLPAQKEKARLEKERERALEKIEHYKLEAKTHAENGNSAVEKKWKDKINATRKELSQVESQLKETEKSIKDVEEKRSLETFKLRDELEAKVKEARKSLLELEASRDAKIVIHKQEMEKLETQSKLICDQIGKIAKLREADVAQFEKLGVRKELGSEGNALFYVPFYVICYKAEQKKRYSIIPPSVATTIGLATKLKGVLGKARIKELLEPRFKTITSLMDTIQLLIQQNAVFEAEINESGVKANILVRDISGAEIKKGLNYLKNEGWLSDKDYDAISQKAK
jgi:hypothetical protein